MISDEMSFYVCMNVCIYFFINFFYKIFYKVVFVLQLKLIFSKLPRQKKIFHLIFYFISALFQLSNSIFYFS